MAHARATADASATASERASAGDSAARRWDSYRVLDDAGKRSAR